jgi:predicted Zn-dependent protease
MPARPSKKKRSRLIVVLPVTAVALAALGVGSYLGLQWWRQRELAALRTQAFALFDEGKFEEALPSLSRIVARNRGEVDAEAIRRLAKARLAVPDMNRAHIPAAARFFAAAIAADPTDVESHRELLRLYMGMRRTVEAEQVAQALLRLDPNEAAATLALVEMLIAKGDGASADRLLEARVKSHPEDIEAKVRLWQRWIATRRPPEDCLVEIDRWLTAEDADPALRVMRAERLRAAGRGPEAQAELVHLMTLEPKSVASCRIVARTLQRLSRFDDAKKVLAEGAARFAGRGGSQLALELFEYGWLSDDLDAAAQAVEIAKGDPKALWANRASLTVPYLRGDAAALDGAVAAFQPTGANATADRDFAAALPLALAARTDPSVMPKANAAIERALLSNAKDPILLYAQTELRLATGDRGSAIASGTAAFEAARNAWVRLGLVLIPAIEAYGDRERAKAVLNDLSDAQIGNPQVQMMLVLASADAVARGESPVIPVNEFTRLTQTLAQQVDTRREIAPLAVLSLLTIDRNDRARNIVERCLKDSTTPGGILLELARVIRQSKFGEQPEASKLIERLLAAAEERGAPALQLETFRASGGRPDQSLPALLTLADAGDRRALQAAAALADATSSEQAPAILERLLREAPSGESVTLVLNSQTALRTPALLEQAIAAAERLEGGRGDTTAIARARLLLAKGLPARGDLDAALDELDELRQRRGETVELLATMASLLLAADPPDLTAASRLAGKAATMAPDRAQLQLLAASLFRQSGNADSATLYLQKAMATAAAKSEPFIRRGIVEELRLSGQAQAAAAEARSLAEATDSSADWIMAADLSQLSDGAAHLERCLRAAVAAPDATPAAWSRLALGLGRAGRVDEGRKVLEELQAKEPESVWLPITVDFSLNFSPPEVATAELDAAIAKYPLDPVLMVNKARERIVRQDPQAALAIAERAAKSEATSLAAREIALQLVGAPDPVGSAAIETLAAAGGVAAEPLRRLRDMRDRKTPPSAEQALAIARTVPGLWTVWAFALDVAASADDPANRLVIAEEAVRALPNDPRAVAACASLMLDGGRPGEARDLAERLRILSGVAPEYRSQATRLAGLAHLGLGQASRAKEILLAGGDPDPDSRLLASAIDAQLGNVAEAYRRAEPIIETSDPAIIFWLRLVGSLGPKEGAAILEAAAAHEARMPNLFASAWILASGRDNSAGLERAARLLESARTAGKGGLENAAVALELAVARDDRTAIEQARTALAAELGELGRELLSGKVPAQAMTDPKDLQAVDSIATEAKGLLERGRDLERAQKLLEAAIEAQATPERRVTLARVLAARGQSDAALELASRLTRQYPASPDAWLALARARLGKRDRDGAALAIERGRAAMTTAFFVAPKVKAEFDAMAGALSALSGSR